MGIEALLTVVAKIYIIITIGLTVPLLIEEKDSVYGSEYHIIVLLCALWLPMLLLEVWNEYSR